MATVWTKENLIEKVKLSLDIPITSDTINKQIEQLIAAGLAFFIDTKGIDEQLIYRDDGIMLVTIFVSDLWQTGGEFKFSPATLMLFDGLCDATRGLKYAVKKDS